MRITVLRPLWVVPVLAWLSACGGGAVGDDPAAAPPVVQAASARAVALASIGQPQRAAAAQATAESADNACAPVRPFYWEIGTRSGPVASGSAGARVDGTRVTAQTPMAYASATKWLYAAYVAELRGGVLTSTDVQMLTMRSGYTHFDHCGQDQTVDACLAEGHNGDHSAATDGRFFYDGGHLQKHASMTGLGAMDNAALGEALQSRLGRHVDIGFLQPQLAGGAYGTPRSYARFLRRLVAGKLVLGSLLGQASVCANPTTCGRQVALASPIPVGETWRYALGHWVETDPKVGDGAFSSPGAFGFYPWIDATRSQYGLVARAVQGGGRASSVCGRLIRKAWAIGAAQ